MKLFGHKLFSFEGRMNRAPYLKMELLILVIASFVSLSGTLADLAFAAFGVLHISLSVRRLHDLDKSGWFAVLLLVPVVGLVLYLYLLVRKGTEGSNRFGPDLV